MSGLTTGVGGFLIVAWTILVWIGYHKIFTVYYLDLSKGLGKELIGSLIAGIILAALTVYLYWLVAIIVFVAGLMLSGKIEEKSRKTTVIVVFAILALVVFFVGRNVKKEANSDTTTNELISEESTYIDTYTENKLEDNSDIIMADVMPDDCTFIKRF